MIILSFPFIETIKHGFGVSFVEAELEDFPI